jgi:hypothetical protein
MSEAFIDYLRVEVLRIQSELEQALSDLCPGEHKYTQHRDRRPPWCSACGYAVNGTKVRDV